MSTTSSSSAMPRKALLYLLELVKSIKAEIQDTHEKVFEDKHWNVASQTAKAAPVASSPSHTTKVAKAPVAPPPSCPTKLAKAPSVSSPSHSTELANLMASLTSEGRKQVAAFCLGLTVLAAPTEPGNSVSDISASLSLDLNTHPTNILPNGQYVKDENLSSMRVMPDIQVRMGNGEPKHQQYEQHKQALPAAELHVSSEGSFGQRTADLDKTLSAMAMERTSLSDTFVSADCIDSVMGDDECESHDNSSLSEGSSRDYCSTLPPYPGDCDEPSNHVSSPALKDQLVMLKELRRAVVDYRNAIMNDLSKSSQIAQARRVFLLTRILEAEPSINVPTAELKYAVNEWLSRTKSHFDAESETQGGLSIPPIATLRGGEPLRHQSNEDVDGSSQAYQPSL